MIDKQIILSIFASKISIIKGIYIGGGKKNGYFITISFVD